ncbi:MAG TPA: 2-oxo-4-hydroxy-4-carboxy-5-ureidoimidazoline decarboxylase [Pseudonocardiaceae bacterium]|jgi:2-oxo-4-hydroxy-4-carboxy-5-ureidoimidazoline decarboxylase|nr:2-oxo-4-hydroxy-4-carboxy-5-ureidoimidazoline decarboxylase [Pseudonocardiaceae bacterium]
MEENFRIAEVDTMPASRLVGLFRQCVAIDRWARELADHRPYASLETLLARAAELSASLSDDEIQHALGDHPRIGERVAVNSMSATEQSGVDSVTLADRLLAANLAYERRFGHIYLVCASGRDGEDLLADLAARMGNDPTTELAVVRRELGKIARLRLERIIGG